MPDRVPTRRCMTDRDVSGLYKPVGEIPGGPDILVNDAAVPRVLGCTPILVDRGISRWRIA